MDSQGNVNERKLGYHVVADAHVSIQYKYELGCFIETYES